MTLTNHPCIEVAFELKIFLSLIHSVFGGVNLFKSVDYQAFWICSVTWISGVICCTQFDCMHLYNRLL